MSLHVDLRLTVAVFSAALCPPWTALGVLQVGLVSPVIRYNDAMMKQWLMIKHNLYFDQRESDNLLTLCIFFIYAHLTKHAKLVVLSNHYWYSNLYGAAGQLPSPVPGIKSFCWINEFVNDNKNSCCSEWKYTVPAPRRPPAITLNKHKNAI